MIREAPLATTDSDVDDDRSMRVVEYLLAIVALVTAVVLAFVR